MTERIVYALQKGGCGKTTSTVATAEILASAGYRVLVVDFDSQGNASKMLTGESIYKFSGQTVMEAIQEGIAEPYIHTVKTNLDLMPAEDRLASLSRYIYTRRIDNPYGVLKRLLEPVESRYDMVFVDVGPTLGDHLINALVYADHLVVPVDSGDLAMDGLLRFIEFVEASKQEGHTKADILGIALTMRDRRSKYEKDVAAGIRGAYGDLVFDTEIGRKVRLKEMSATGMDLKDPAMEDYYKLTEEIMNRIKRKEKENE